MGERERDRENTLPRKTSVVTASVRGDQRDVTNVTALEDDHRGQ